MEIIEIYIGLETRSTYVTGKQIRLGEVANQIKIYVYNSIRSLFKCSYIISHFNTIKVMPEWFYNICIYVTYI